jgi:hypothetical protein
METKKNFEDEFTSLCDLLGEKSTKLFQELGKPDDIDENEDRTYVCFNSNHSHFGFNNNSVFRIQMPIADSFGHAFETDDTYYSFNGLTIGMSKDEVISVWGQPKSSGTYRWGLGSVKTSNGRDIDVFINFSESAEDVYYLSSFEAVLNEKEPFEDVFLKASDFIGGNESAVINTLGNPEKSSVSSGGTKALFYLNHDIMFMVPQNTGIVERVGSPITLTNSKIESGYFNLHGIRLGDSKDRVATVWGTPTENTERVWVYSDKTGTTSNGYKFETELTFKDGIVEDFQSKIVRQAAPKSKSGCFVATACYGDYNSEEVLVLREFRDNVLLNSTAGLTFVKFYYFVSPPIAKFIEKSSILKSIIRKGFLSPIIRKIKKNQ